MRKGIIQKAVIIDEYEVKEYRTKGKRGTIPCKLLQE
jgi:hypothetical protein